MAWRQPLANGQRPDGKRYPCWNPVLFRSKAGPLSLVNVRYNDPASGVMRHADAGYAKAIDVAKQKKLNLPMLR